jgi:hypothetical protein
VYQITITNQTGHGVRLNGYEVAQFSASGKQVYLDVYTDQQYGGSGQFTNSQYIAPGQSVSGEDDTGVWASSCKLAGWQ